MDRENFEAILNDGGFTSPLYVAGSVSGVVYVCPTRGDADTLHEIGYDAAYSGDGWPASHADQLRDQFVLVLDDGTAFAAGAAVALFGVARWVKVLNISISAALAELGIDGLCNELARLEDVTEEWTPADFFAPLDPFDSPDVSKLPPFPVDSLTPVLREMAVAVAESLQVAVDMPSLQLLAVAALCLQGKFIINPKPGWVEPLNIYAVTVARPSDRKSPTVQVCTKYLRKCVHEENNQRKPQIDEYNMKRDILVKQIEDTKARIVRPAKGKTPATFDDVIELQYQLSDLEREEIKPLRMLADDVTPEALTSLLAQNDGKMGIISDEGGIFDVVAGRYSDKANLDVFLKAYNGAPIQIDRKGRPSESIDHPVLTLSLTIQPVVLENIMQNVEFSGRGFLARFLYSIPVSTVGGRRYETAPIPLQVEEPYNQLIDRLLSIEDTGEARTIKLSPEAHAESKRFFEALEARLITDLEDVEEWAGKFHGQIMRIAGILHCCQHGREAASKLVSLDTILQAETIGGYFLEHAQAAFRAMGATDKPEEADAKYILRRLQADGKLEITKRDLMRLCRKFKNADELSPGLTVLANRGYIRIDKSQTVGRPTEKVFLNPKAA